MEVWALPRPWRGAEQSPPAPGGTRPPSHQNSDSWPFLPVSPGGGGEQSGPGSGIGAGGPGSTAPSASWPRVTVGLA